MQARSVHDEHIEERVRGKYIGDFVYGANDGIITTFAVVSGAAGASLSSGVIIALGFANLMADGISMGLSNYLAIRSKLDYEKKERRHEEKEIEELPAEERKEMEEILISNWRLPARTVTDIADVITSDKELWIKFMMREELNIIEDGDNSPTKHALATTISFACAGFLPLTPFVFGVNPDNVLLVSVSATALSLFLVGTLRTLVTKTNWLASGLQMLGVGIIASTVAYFVGLIIKEIIGVSI